MINRSSAWSQRIFLLLALVLGTVLIGISSVRAADVPETIWGDATTTASGADGQSWDLGTVFQPTVSGTIIGVRAFASADESGIHQVRIWRNSDNTVISGPHDFEYSGSGWHEFSLPEAVALTANVEYTVAISTGEDATRSYALIQNALSNGGDNGGSLAYPANAGVYSAVVGVRPTSSWNATNYLRDVVFVADEVTPPTDTDVVFSDDFETGLDWQKADDVNWYTGTPKNGTHSVRLRRDGTITKNISLADVSDITVSFAFGAWSLDSSNEYAAVEYFDGGTWIELARINNNTANENNRLNNYSLDLPTSQNDNSAFALRFRLQGSGTGDYAYVDDVVVRGVPTGTLPTPTATIAADPTSIIEGESSTLTWSSLDATTCVGDGFDTGGEVEGFVTVSPTTDTTYGVTCTGDGGSATDSVSVSVIPLLTVTVSADPSSGIAPLSVAFSSLVSGGTGSYTFLWDFGDNSNANTQDSLHQYTSPDSYLATVTVTSGTQSVTKSVTVTVSAPAPTVTLTADPISIIEGESSTLTWTSLDSTTCVGEGFDTGGKVDGFVSVSPSGDTTYSITCTGDGGSDTDIVTVAVTPLLSVTASADQITGVAPLDVSFSVLVIGGTGSYSYLWDFGDTNTANIQDPVHEYTSPGSYLATVSVTSGTQTKSANVNVEVTAPTPTPTPAVIQTLFSGSDTPITVTANDTGAVELGVKFHSAVDGYVSAIRFYKGPENLGTHTVTLWDTAGAPLGTATVSNETASGWQQADFSAPIAITADTTYVASYFAPQGKYSADANYFSTDRVSGDLTAPASSTSDGNGVYKYGGTSVFPNDTYNASNYWVDVVFAPSVIEPVTTVTVNADPTSIITGQSSTVTWASINADTCTGTNFSTDNAVSGSVTVSPAITTTYAITCTGTSGNVTKEVTVTVTPFDPEDSPVKLGINADLGGMKPFPADDPWNQNIENLPLHPEWGRIQNEMDALNAGWREGRDIRADFGSGTYDGSPIGIPYIVAPIDQPLVPIINQNYGGDEGPYPMPPNTPIENINATDYADRHAIVVQRDTSKPNHIGHIFELFRAYPQGDYPNSVTEWWASSYAKFDANANTLESRAIKQSSTDAAGLPIFPGLVRYDEVQHAIATQGRNGDLGHALRFTVNEFETEWSLIRPATEVAGHNTGPIPFGARFRLRSDWQIDPSWPDELAIIINTLKRYGMIQADNSAYWGITGAPDERWNNDWLAHIRYIKAGDFEMVDTGPIIYKSPGGDPITPTPEPTPTPDPTPTPTPDPSLTTIWTDSTTPATVTVNDASAVELGVKFKASQDGNILGIRFYKGPQNTGTHIGNLWSSDGTQLATATFTNESVSGWQEVRFASPVAITADTVYVASYYAPNGYYSGDSNTLTNDYTSSVLTIPSSDSSGGNGIYLYSASSAFPTETYNATNYWVDVVFSTTLPSPTPTPGPDTSAPTVPADVVAKGVSDRTVNLKWTASTDDVGVTGYDIYRNGTKIGSSTSPSFSDTDLDDATTYTYTIDAYDAATNRSTASAEVTATTLSADAYAVAPPIPPSPYTLPEGAIRVTNSAELLEALSNNTNANIVLADGTYDHTTYFSACDNKLWSENLLGATLTAGIEFGGNYCTQGGGEIHGIRFDVSTDTKTLLNSIVHAWGAGPGDLKIQDSVFDGNWQVWNGLYLLYVENNIIERNEFYHFRDIGMRVSDTAYVGFIQYGDPVKAINHISDIFVDGVSRTVPGESNGTGEMGLWVGNPVTNGVERIKIRNVSWTGINVIENPRDTIFQDLDIDMNGQYIAAGVPVYLEHWSYFNEYRRFWLRGATGFNCEWADPAWGGTPGCRNNLIHTGIIDGVGNWPQSIGVNLDDGSWSTTVRNVKFIGQSKAAINLNNVEGVNDLEDNDFTGIAPEALPIRYGHPYF